jgi:hypothetical protein
MKSVKFTIKDIKGDIILSSLCPNDWIKYYKKNDLSKYLKLLIACSSNNKFKRFIKNDSNIIILGHMSKKNQDSYQIKIDPFGINGVARYTIIVENL